MGAIFARAVGCLYAYDKTPKPIETPSEILDAPKSLSILFVEENDDFSMNASRLLKSIASYDISVFHITDIDMARNSLERQTFDAALIGNCSGFNSSIETLGSLGAGHRLCAPILLTDELDESVRKAASKAGAVTCLARDQLTPILLEETIRSALHTFSLESELQRLHQELERARQAHSDLMRRTLQDLEVPLRAMMQSSKTITSAAEEPHEDPDCKDAAELIKASSHYLSDLVSGLTKPDRKPDGRQENIASVESIGDLVGNAVRMAQSGMQKSSRRISMTLPHNPIHVCGRRTDLMQGLLKILNYAVGATPEGGKIDVVVDSTERHVRICVSDSSQQLSHRDIDTVLHTSFGLGSASSTPTFQAAHNLRGIRDIVADHNGQLEIESVPGRGTTIALRLPVAMKACDAA